MWFECIYDFCASRFLLWDLALGSFLGALLIGPLVHDSYLLGSRFSVVGLGLKAWVGDVGE